MKLTKSDWNKWKKNYTNVLDFDDYKAIEDHFNKKSKKNKYEKNIVSHSKHFPFDGYSL